MGTGKIVLGDASTSGKLSQTEGNWTWTNNIQLLGAANQILNNGTGADRYNKLQGVISGSGGVSFSDSTGAMSNGDRGFILTGANTMDGVVTVDTFVRVGGVAGNDVSLSGGASGTLGAASVVINSGKRLTFSRTDSHIVANSISGGGDLYVGSTGITGTGSQVLTYNGSATYTGNTSVSAGKLLVNGSLGNTTVTVASGATLGGTGTIAGAVNVSGVLAPGASVASFSTGALSFSSGSSFSYELDSTVGLGSAADLQSVNGGLDLSGTVTLVLADLATGGPAVAFAQNTVFTLINYTGLWNGGFFTWNSQSLADGDTFTAGLNVWQIDYNATSGGTNFAGEYVAGNFVNITAVPEPAAGLIGGLGVLLLLRRRR
jgi:autotransporter-associated beta strand protein